MANVEYVRRHKDLGLCIECNDKAVTGYIRCIYHLSVDNERHRRSYRKNREKKLEKRRKEIKWRIENHRCRTCGAPMEAEWETRECPNCSTRTFRGV